VTRVLQVMAGAHHGGAEAFFLRLTSALFRAGIEEHVIMRRDQDRSAALRQAGLEPVELPFGGIPDVVTRPRVKKEISAFDPDIVIAWMSRAARYCPKGKHVLAARLGGYYKLKYYRHCDHLIANTRSICDYLISENWPSERVTYLPNFVDGTPAPPIDRAIFSTPEDGPLLLALGRLHENKAFDILLDALQGLPNAYLWIAGEGALRRTLEARSRHLGIADRVRWLGWRSDVSSLLATADVLVCPSRHEPLGNVVIEAWAHGCPVVAAESQGPKWLIEANDAGLLVPIDNAGALARTIDRLVNHSDIADDLVARGNEAYAQDYTEDVVVQRYIEFFDRVSKSRVSQPRVPQSRISQ
jgi:glycosyltransferase involved in cell wall biosynthesis